MRMTQKRKWNKKSDLQVVRFDEQESRIQWKSGKEKLSHKFADNSCVLDLVADPNK